MRAVAVLVLLAACTPDFAAPSDVADLRVLAVTADPPEALFDPDGGSSQPVAIRVLAVDPARDAGPQTMELQICGQTDSRRCDEGPVADAGTVPLAFTLPPIDATPFVESDKLSGYAGIRVQLSFSVDDGSPRGPVYGDKVLIYSPANAPWVTGSCAPNHNPQIEPQVAVTIDGGPVGVLPGLPLTAGIEYGLRPQVTAGSREQYCTLDLRGNLLTDLQEQPRWFFFTAPGGSFDRETADEPLDGGAAPDGLTRFTPSADGGTIWIVVRDARGGESWLTLPWTGR